MATSSWKELTSLILLIHQNSSDKINFSHMSNPLVETKILPEVKPSIDSLSSSSSTRLTDYRILMLKRTDISSFIDYIYVFPGGDVNKADFSSKWWNVFKRKNISPKDLCLTLGKRVKGDRPPIIQSNKTIQDELDGNLNDANFLPPYIGLRIASIRQAFRETGILLLTDSEENHRSELSSIGVKNDDNDKANTTDIYDTNIDLSEWRKKVREDPIAFLDLCLTLNLLPNIWSLYEWSNWLTPTSAGHRRFDTLYYICCLNEYPKIVLDSEEKTSIKWSTPLDFLDDHKNEKIYLSPIHVYELSRIQNFNKLNDLEEFSRTRESYGIQRWMPVIATYDDGAISFLPGDDMYPKQPEYTRLKPVPDYSQTLMKMRLKVTNLNRIEICGSICTCICNQKLPNNHLTPITYPPLTSSVQSML